MTPLLLAVTEHEPTFWTTRWGRRPWIGYGLSSESGRFELIDGEMAELIQRVQSTTPEHVDGFAGRFWFLHHAELYLTEVAQCVRDLQHDFRWADIDGSVIQNNGPSTTGAHFDDAHGFLVQVAGSKRLRILVA